MIMILIIIKPFVLVGIISTVNVTCRCAAVMLHDHHCWIMEALTRLAAEAGMILW